MAYNNRGVAHLDKRQYDQAISDYSKAIELNPKDADAYKNRGAAYLDKGQYNQAISDYNKAIELNPKGMLTLITIGGLPITTKASMTRSFLITTRR
jgi:tetratricopeptide (TPR) repeat protein